MTLRAMCRFGTLCVAMLLIAGVSSAQDKQVKKEPIKASNPSSGAEMYKQYCAVCHGKTGKGDGPAAARSENCAGRSQRARQEKRRQVPRRSRCQRAAQWREGARARNVGHADMGTAVHVRQLEG